MFGRDWKQNLFKPRGWLIGSLALSMSALGLWIQPAANAEGSRNLYPSSSPGGATRANLEWRTETYGGLITRRTLLKVYANAGEYVLVGSTAVGIANGATKGDIYIYNPGGVTGIVGSESIPASPDFKCSSQSGKGFISSRTQELAGPQAISGGGNSTGYVPCYYQAPSSGVYDVVIFGPSGFNATGDGGVTSDLDIGTTASKPNNFNSTQGTSVAAWDVTVRSSTTSTTDITGRVYSYYLALFTGSNGRPIYSTIYTVTTDGYKYRTDVRGLDPNGFVLYGNDLGFFNSDGATPLYHDVVGTNGQVASPDGGVTLSNPQYPIFFNQPANLAISTAELYNSHGVNVGTGISTVPIAPSVTAASFAGTVSSNTSKQGTGGTFTFNSSVSGTYEIVIQGNGSNNFDPTNPLNRVLRGVTAGGNQSVTWDGKDNSGNYFPVGTNYPVKIRVHAGEYHFPMLDAENNFYGGPTITLLNPPAGYPSDIPGFGTTTGFYDDRVYKTIGGTYVGTLPPNSAPSTQNQAICGINPPSPTFSNPVTGFDTSSNQRAYGQNGNLGNTNVRCTGSFGDTKGLDQWTYFPSAAAATTVNIVANVPDLTITKTHTGNFNQGSTGSYTITATNAGGVATTGTVTVTDTLPTGLTPTSASGTGWNCTISGQTVTCTRSDALASGSSYPAITLNVAVASNAAASITNTVTVSGGGETNTANDSASDATTVVAAGNPAHLLLVKRITRINFTDITGFIDDPNTTDDNDPNWPAPTSTSLRGAIDGGKVLPGDEVEYTIYFLSNGGNAAKNVTICDLVPANQTFIFNAFNGLTPTDGGTATADSGIALALSSTSLPTDPTVYLSNIADADRGQFIRSGATLPTACSGSNTNGAVLVNIVTGATTLPYATAPGTPFNSYGFIRFRAKVN